MMLFTLPDVLNLLLALNEMSNNIINNNIKLMDALVKLTITLKEEEFYEKVWIRFLYIVHNTCRNCVKDNSWIRD